MTPRGNFAEGTEGNNFLKHLHHGQVVQMEAPQQQQQQGSEEHHWVDQRQWEERQRRNLAQQQQQLNEGSPYWQQQKGETQAHYDAPLDTDKLTLAVLQHLQQQPQLQQQTEDLNKMVGEGEWKAPRKGSSWVYSRALSGYTGFTSKQATAAEAAAADNSEQLQKQSTGLQAVNSGIYVEGVKQWNATTNSPVLPVGEEGKNRGRRQLL